MFGGKFVMGTSMLISGVIQMMTPWFAQNGTDLLFITQLIYGISQVVQGVTVTSNRYKITEELH